MASGLVYETLDLHHMAEKGVIKLATSQGKQVMCHHVCFWKALACTHTHIHAQAPKSFQVQASAHHNLVTSK